MAAFDRHEWVAGTFNTIDCLQQSCECVVHGHELPLKIKTSTDKDATTDRFAFTATGISAKSCKHTAIDGLATSHTSGDVGDDTTTNGSDQFKTHTHKKRPQLLNAS